jgi:hypothetical protein
MTLAEWVRNAMREQRGRETATSAERKLAVVRAAVEHRFPSADLDQMLAEIEHERF